MLQELAEPLFKSFRRHSCAQTQRARHARARGRLCADRRRSARAGARVADRRVAPLALDPARDELEEEHQQRRDERGPLQQAQQHPLRARARVEVEVDVELEARVTLVCIFEQ